MTWLQVELRVTADNVEAAEHVLLECGAVSVTLVSDSQEPVLEPEPGQTPLWSSIRVQALYPLDIDMAFLRKSINAQHDLVDAGLSIDFVGEQDWQLAASNHAVNQVFADRLWLLPKDAPLEAQDGLVALRLEPGLAFGSGSHPTTRMCLQWLAENIQPGMRVLDFGCGSGVLGIAAALLGSEVVAVDYDEQAVVASRENAAYNDVSQIQVMSLEAWQSMKATPQFDVVVANILAAPLQSLAQEFEAVLVPGGAVVLSGILEEQAEQVMGSYTQTTFAASREEEGWVCLSGRVSSAERA